MFNSEQNQLYSFTNCLLVTSSNVNFLQSKENQLKICIIGDFIGSILKSQPMTDRDVCQYLWNYNWNIDVVEDTLYHSVGDFLLVIDQPEGPIMLTSPGFSGIYYVHNDGRWYFGSTFNDLATIYPEAFQQLDEYEVFRFIADNINLSPLRTFWKDVKRLAGGCKLTLSANENQPETYLIKHSNKKRNNENVYGFDYFCQTIDLTADLLARFYHDRLFLIPVSGGIDGILWLCAMAKTGASILAICGEMKGDSDEIICEQIVNRLKHIGYKNIEYHSAVTNEIDNKKARTLTQKKIKWLIKSNYLQDTYKLKLVDLEALEIVDPNKTVFINGYGIDELYMGTKDDPRFSSIYKSTLFKQLGTLVNHLSFLDFSIRFDWLLFRIRNVLGIDDKILNLKRVLEKRALSGKVLCDKTLWFGMTKKFYDQQISRQIDDILNLLSSDIPSDISYLEFRSYIKTFMYFHTENIHLIRFANHGRSIGSIYLLPYEFGPVRSFFDHNNLSINDGYNPKRYLYEYVNKILGTNYYQSIQIKDPRNSFINIVNELIKKIVYKIFRLPVLRNIYVLIKAKGGKYPKSTDRHNQTLQICYQDIAHHRKVLLKKTSDELSNYITELDKSLVQAKHDMDSYFLDREYENYVHLLYLLGKSAKVNNEKQTDY